MRILHTNFLRGWGGQSNRILNEATGIAGRGHDVLVAAPAESELIKRAREAGLPTDNAITFAGIGRPSTLRDIPTMRRLVGEFRPDIIHLHGGRDSWITAGALAATRSSGRPVIVRTKHNMFPIVGHPLNRWFYGTFCDELISISTAIHQDLAGKQYIDAKRITLIPSATDVEQFRLPPDTRERMRRELHIQPDHIVIAMTGRLRPEKGHHVLLQAAPEILRADPNVRFLLLGSGSMHGELGQQLQQSGLASHIIMAGFRTDIPECLSAADLYVQPSLSEGLGTSVIEACAAGLPVVASRTGGIPDIIRDRETGLLVEPANATDLVRAVRELLSDVALRQQLARSGRDHVERVYSLETLIESTERAYVTFLQRRRA